MQLKLNRPYLDMMKNMNRFCLIVGGAGSGKSYATAQKVVMLLTTLSFCKVLLLRQTRSSIRESQFDLIRTIIVDCGLHNDFEFIKSRLEIINKKNGNRLISQGLDDVEKLKSINDVTHVWIEEATEIRELDFEQINLRLRYQHAVYLQILLTFNPLGENHWIKKRFFDEHHPDVYIVKTTYRDNYHNLPQVYRDSIENLRHTNAGMYQIYALGNWSNVTENGVFQLEHFREFDADKTDDSVVKVMYCDPNLSEKGKGDTTAIVVLGYSHTYAQIRIYDVFCESIPDANQLFDIMAKMAEKNGVRAIDMDGNVTQESTYKNLFKAWMSKRGLSMKVNFRRYRVNDLVKITQLHWVAGDIVFLRGLNKCWRQFFAQFWAFEGKKTERKKDDAPDSVICGVESLYQYKLLKFLNNITKVANGSTSFFSS